MKFCTFYISIETWNFRQPILHLNNPSSWCLNVDFYWGSNVILWFFLSSFTWADLNGDSLLLISQDKSFFMPDSRFDFTFILEIFTNVGPSSSEIQIYSSSIIQCCRISNLFVNIIGLSLYITFIVITQIWNENVKI